jgi:tetratricopeptide (TPR) repeat protein
VSNDPLAFERASTIFTVMKIGDPWAKLAAAYDIVGDQSAVSRMLEQHREMAIHFADIAADAKDWDLAITLYNRLITPDTTDADLLGKRAAAYIATERWELAKADWLRVIKLKPQLALSAFDQLTAAQRWNEASQFGLMALAQNSKDSILWLRIAAAGAISGDRVGYEAICKWIAEQPLETTELAERAIKCCLLQPGAIDINKLPGNVLAKGLSDGTVPESVVFWYWSSRALLAYRSGDAESALSFANKSESFHPNDLDHALNLSILALAHHQLKQSEEAQNAYAEGIRIIQRLKEDPKNRVSHDVLIPELLLREAEVRINGTNKP